MENTNPLLYKKYAISQASEFDFSRQKMAGVTMSV